MYHRGVTYSACHEVHGTEYNADLLRPANSICLNCHGPQTPNGPSSKHNYRLEPNVSFTPDQKWVVFRSNMFGATYAFAVEVAK